MAGHDDDLHMIHALFHSLQELNPVHPRQAKIGEDKGWIEAEHPGEGLLGIVGHLHLIPTFFQDGAHHCQVVGIVVDHQEVFRRDLLVLERARVARQVADLRLRTGAATRVDPDLLEFIDRRKLRR